MSPLIKSNIHSVTYCQSVAIDEKALKETLKELFATQFEVDNVTHALVILVQKCYQEPQITLTQGLEVYSYQLQTTNEETAHSFAAHLSDCLHYAFSEDFLFHEKVKPLVDKTRNTNIHNSNAFNFANAPAVQQFFIESLPSWCLKNQIEKDLPVKEGATTKKKI